MRLFNWSKWVLLVGIGITSLSVQAAGGGSGILMGVNLGAFHQTEEEGAAKSEFTFSNTDANIGVVLGSGLYIGGIYGSQSEDNGTLKPAYTHYGATLGYFSSSWFVQAHYLMGGEVKKQAANTDWEEGAGSQVDLGYFMNVSGPFYAGVQLSYRSMKYEKKLVSGVESVGAEALERSEYFPSFRLTLIW